MKFKISLSKIRGLGLIFWTDSKYYALWLEWADGGQVMLDGSMKTMWAKPQVRFVHT